MVPILDLLANCRKYGDRVAIVAAGRSLTYAGLHAAVTAQAARLAARLRPGDRMALLCGNTLEFVTLSLAAEAIGAIRVPLNVKSTPSEIAALLADCAPGLVVYEEATEPLLAGAGGFPAEAAAGLCAEGPSSAPHPAAHPAPGPEARCSITYTSGSTGRPKGVVLTHANWHYVFVNMLIERAIAADDTLAFIGPLTHAGWSYLYAGLLRGARAAIFPAGDVEAMLDHAAREPVSIVTCVPTTLSRVVALAGPDHPLCASLKWIGIGGAPTSPALLERAMAVFGRRIVFNFGQTEAMMTCTFYDFAREPDRPGHAGFIGRPYVFADVAIMGPDGAPVAQGEVGEICVRGPHTMLEYWGQPELTAKARRDGFILTGDLGSEDEPGLFRIVGRAKEMIISGGFNIFPQEVEAAVAALDGVEEAAVLGLPSEEWGEMVACVFATRDGREIAAEAMRAALKPRLGIRTPKLFRQIEALPKAATGKIDKNALRRWLEAGQ